MEMGRLKCGLMREPHVAACLVPLEQCMDLQAATTALREKVGNDCGLGTTLKFDCGADGCGGPSGGGGDPDRD